MADKDKAKKIDISELAKLDLYGILEVAPDATEKQLVKAYRKKALKCHPDKNPDNPRAAELFHELSKALEVLSDAAARAAYDRILKAREAAELRNKALDSSRKKFKGDLEAREKAADQKRFDDITATRNLKEEIERLRDEGSKLLEDEQERLKEELKKERELREADTVASNDDEVVPARLRAKWKAKKGDAENGGYSHEILTKAFNKYGVVTALIVSSKKNGSAIVEFASPYTAVMAVQYELGLTENPLTLSWISGEPCVTLPETLDSSAPKAGENPSKAGLLEPPLLAPPSVSNMATDERDFENIVLMKMRQAQERKKLMEQMQNEDTEET